MIKLLANLVETFIPVVGDIIENIKSKDGGVGRFFAPKFVKQVIRLAVALATIYLVIRGELNPDVLNTL
jgi:hypothetical protein